MDLLITLFTIDTLVKIGFGTIIGICLGLTGVGGGVLIIPILQVIFGMHIVMAVGTASLISTFVKITAGISHIRAGNVDWCSLKWMLLGSVPATLITTEIIMYLNETPSTQIIISHIIEVAVIIIMIFSLYTMYKKYISVETVFKDKVYSSRMAVSSGVTCGSVLGATGVGGGVLLLPAFNTLLGLSIKKSIGSSIVMALVLSALTALNYSKGGQSDILTAILISLGSFFGVPVSIRFLTKLSDKKIYLITMIIIFISLLMMFL